MWKLTNWWMTNKRSSNPSVQREVPHGCHGEAVAKQQAKNNVPPIDVPPPPRRSRGQAMLVLYIKRAGVGSLCESWQIDGWHISGVDKPPSLREGKAFGFETKQGNTYGKKKSHCIWGPSKSIRTVRKRRRALQLFYVSKYEWKNAKIGLILRRGKLIGFETKQDQHSWPKHIGRRVTASFNSIIPFKEGKACQGEEGRV